MRIGVPKEIKSAEQRVGLTPAAARELVALGHSVLVECGAGVGIGASDAAYRQAGAATAASAQQIFAEADIIVKVKEPQPNEVAQLRTNQVLFTYLHLAADRELTLALLRSGCTAIAYETITDRDGGLPLLAPMSEIAGRMSVQVGAQCLHHTHGGMGKLLSGIPGVAPAKVLVIGGGTAGAGAARMAAGLGAAVTVLDTSLSRLRRLDEMFGGRVEVLHSSPESLEACVLGSDLVIGAALIPGAAAPRLVTRALVHAMRRGSALVDIAIDQGGCFETSRPTSHDAPTFVDAGVVHYCVTNMPGAVPMTSSHALNQATLPYLRKLAAGGVEASLRADPHLRRGLNAYRGELTHPAVAASLDLPYCPPESLLH
jgi:alanine dehydrogenase